ncbi:MAG: Sec-independent protein translocase protein TatB [Caulobacteraceae bacterium]
MLPDVGGSEYLLIAAVALIVIGPKDLPKMLRKLGQMVGKMRAMAAEFRSSFDEMARQSELDDLRKEVEAMRTERLDPMRAAVDSFNAETSAAVMPEWPAPTASYEPPPAPVAAPAPKPKRAVKPRTAATAKAAPKPRAKKTPS